MRCNELRLLAVRVEQQLKGGQGGFWEGAAVLFLDLGVGYICSVCSKLESDSCMCTFLYICLNSIKH